MTFCYYERRLQSSTDKQRTGLSGLPAHIASTRSAWLRRAMVINSLRLKSHLVAPLIALWRRCVASVLVGMMTSGRAAPYAFVGMWAWGTIAKIGGEALANERLILVPVVAVIHGLVFSVIVTLGRLALPRLREPELGGNVLLVATILYGLLLALAFPLTE